MSQLSEALFTETQQRVLGLLFGQSQRSFYTNEILRLTGMGVATIKRELDRMHKAGILTLQKIGNQHHYQANPQCPIYHELIGIIKKTVGLVDLLRLALTPLVEKIDYAFVYGSVAGGKETADSDIDLMIVGEVGFAEIISLLYPIQESAGREINPKIYHPDEWQNLIKKQDSFIKDVMNKPHMDVIGTWNESG
ncbi:MAG: nucleotidyltransferase domain-containing protein [Methylophaga sp.]|nr:nucleotidyltransferase domain-containing protein [Methylophaga sp.]